MKIKTPKGTELSLIDLRGKSYLEVKYRLVWFREEHPDWPIETMVTISQDACLSKATIKDNNGTILATAHKYEDKKGFADYIEKSETGAIGRALALLGYGTQFAPEIEEGDRIVDAPVDNKSYKPTTTIQLTDKDYICPFKKGPTAGKDIRTLDSETLSRMLDFLESNKKGSKSNFHIAVETELDLRASTPISQMAPSTDDNVEDLKY